VPVVLADPAVAVVPTVAAGRVGARSAGAPSVVAVRLAGRPGALMRRLTAVGGSASLTGVADPAELTAAPGRAWAVARGAPPSG